MDRAIADLAELRELAARLGFPLDPEFDCLRDSVTPVLGADVDYDTAVVTGYAIARYKLADRLHGVLAALRAWDGKGDLVSGQETSSLREVDSSHLADEIEITPAMIAAGAAAIGRFCESFDAPVIFDEHALALEVYKAMRQLES